MTNQFKTAASRTGKAPENPRVLVVLPDPSAARDPQIRTEIAALESDHEVGVLTLPGTAAQDREGEARAHARILAEIAAFGPAVLHAHGLGTLVQVGRLAQDAGLPFTLRAHARDCAPLRPLGFGERMMRALRRAPPAASSAWLGEAQRALAGEWCLGVLTLPFARPWLERAGFAAEKLVACFPALDFAAFHDRRPNGDAVMSLAPAAPPPRLLPDILRLAAKVPGRSFTCYAPPEAAARLAEREARLCAGIAVLAPPPDRAALAAAYKRHRWLVLTADTDAGTADWPLAIAEAQAAGVGVCMPMLRPDLAGYVGAGAGILYGTIDELPAIVSGPLPEEMRERGFAQAMKSDIARHRHLLTDLWERALRRPAAAPRSAAEAALPPRVLHAPGPAADLASPA